MSDEFVRMRKTTMDSIAQAIQEKEGSAEKITGSEMPDRIRAIQSGGLNYLDYVQSCTFTSLNVFGSRKVELTLPNATTLNVMFTPTYATRDEYEANVNTTVEELVIHCPNPVTGISRLFDLASYASDACLRKLTFDVDFSGLSNINLAFKNLNELEVVDGNPINLNSVGGAATDFMVGCVKMKDIRFVGLMSQNWGFYSSWDLSKDTIMNIMSCLSPSVSGKTLTLPRTAVDTAFETSAGANDGSTSAEWLALVESHSNWTISLR